MTTEVRFILAADDSRAVAALTRTDASLRRVGTAAEYANSRARVLGASIGGLAAGLVGALSIRTAADFFRSTVDGIDALNDAADATGSTVEKLSALERIARQNGGTLGDVTDTIVRFNSALNDADGRNGVGAALKAIGLNAKELRAQDPAEAVRRVAQALNGYADDGSKARIVQELLGRGAKEAAPFLKDLAEAGELVATTTKAQAEEAERFNKAMFGVQTSAAELARSLVSDLLPALTEIAKRAVAARQAFGNGFEQFRVQGFGALGFGNLGSLESARTYASEQQGILQNLRDQAARGGLNEAQMQLRELTEEKLANAQRVIDYFERFAAIGDKIDAASTGDTRPSLGSLAGLRDARTKKQPSPGTSDPSIGPPTFDQMYPAADIGAFLKEQYDNADPSRLFTMFERDQQDYVEKALKERQDMEVQAAIERREALRPQWEKDVAAWRDVNARMAEISAEFQDRWVDGGRAAFTEFIQTGKVSFENFRMIVVDTLTKLIYDRYLSESFGNFGKLLFTWLTGTAGTTSTSGAGAAATTASASTGASIQAAGRARASSAGGQTFIFNQQYGSNITRAELQATVAQGNRAVVAEIMDRTSRGNRTLAR